MISTARLQKNQNKNFYLLWLKGECEVEKRRSSRQQAKDEVISFGKNSCRSRQEGGKKYIYVLDGININPQFYPDGVISQLSFYNTQFGGKMVNFGTGSYL